MSRILPIVPLLVTACLAQQQQQPGPTEMATRELEAPPTFRSKVNLVLVPVIVRDKKGDPIGNLKKEDFEVYDKGKLQVIEKFSVEKAGSLHVEFEPQAPEDLESADKVPMAVAERYTAFLFDDNHLMLGDLMQARIAAEKHVAEGILPTERIAVYTTSGRKSLELTDDREAIIQAMRGITPTGLVAESRRDCPPMTHYMADQIVNKNDTIALQVAVADTLLCANLDPATQMDIATQQAKISAQRALTLGDNDARIALINLKNIIRRLAMMPGQRNLVLISPGFIIPYLHSDVTDLIDLAIRNRVTINTLDARGLHLLGAVGDASERTYDTRSGQARIRYDGAEAVEGSMLLGELADGTAGVHFHNNNDLKSGFTKLTTTPAFTYILGFAPQNLRMDGSMHPLRVKLKNGLQLTVQARRGYYAPKHLEDPKEEERREIHEAIFSREVLRDLPVELHTQFFKSNEFDAKLGVLAKVDLSKLQYRKAEGRNLNNLTIVAALFDRNGNYLKGASKMLEMKLKDETLLNKARSVVTIKTNFDVKIGGYVIRLVVRDSEGRQMAAENGSVIIP